MLTKRKPELYPSEQLSPEGKKYGVNIRPVVWSYINNIKTKLYPNPDMDDLLLIVWHSGINKYVIVDGQHLFSSRPKEFWSCELIEGDIANNQELVRECRAHSLGEKLSDNPMRYSHQCLICHELHEEFVKENPSRRGVNKYIESLTCFSSKQIRDRKEFYFTMKDANVLQECIDEDLSKGFAQDLIDGKHRSVPKENEYEDGICQQNVEDDKLYQERQKPATGEVHLDEIPEDDVRSHITIGQEKELKEHIYILQDEIKSFQILSQEHNILTQSYDDLSTKYSELKYEFDTFIKQNKTENLNAT